MRTFILHDKIKVILYGAGIYGRYVGRFLKNKHVEFKFSDKNKELNCVDGVEVIAPNDIKNYKSYDILLTSPKYMFEMYKFLKHEGVDEKRIFTAEEILKEISEFDKEEMFFYMSKSFELKAYLNGMYVLNHVDCMITTKCTLRCKDCESLMPYYKKTMNYDVNEMMILLKKLFDAKIWIDNLSIIGGEPFINQESMVQLLDFCRDESRINRVDIYSNGTIVPKEKTIKAMKDYPKLKIIYSNYGRLSSKLEESINVLHEHGIYFFKPSENDEMVAWFQVGEVKDYGRDDDDIQKMFIKCREKDYCHSLLNGKFYRCTRLANSIEARLISPQKEDYVDVRKLKGFELQQEIKKILTTKKYLPGCKYCLIDQKIKVPRAVQLK